MGEFRYSDAHLSHENILGWRGNKWADIHEMNEFLIEQWNSVVGPDDTVVILGDIVMGKRAESLPLVARLNGTKKLRPGNHDHCHPMYWSEKKWAKFSHHVSMYEAAGLEILPPHGQFEYTFGGERFRVGESHFPFEGDHTDEIRYQDWRPSQFRGDVDILLHGHIHGAWKSQVDSVSGAMQVDVGVDSWDFKPVSVDEVVQFAISELSNIGKN